MRRTSRPPLMMALEPRVMFDGAAAPTAHVLHAEHHADHLQELSTEPAHSVVEPARTEPVRSEPARSPAVVFIDSRVEDAADLLKGVAPGTEIVTLLANRDGLQQIATYLSHHHEVGSVDIIAHGGAGDLLLGSTDVTAENLGSFSRSLTQIGGNLKAGADILVYACNTAATARGVSFVDALAKDTGHVVAASSNVTGAGGDWNLEVATGTITAHSALAKSSEARYAYTLGTTAVGTAAQLIAAITADDLDATNDTITLTSNITYSALSNNVTIAKALGTLTIDGGGYTIDAASLSRVLNVAAGNVLLENVTIEHGLVAAAGGTLSLPGASALGGGIYNAGTLTLNNVLVTQNVATGGGGGGAGVVGAGGGGGGGIGQIGGATGGGIGAGTGGSGSGGKGSGTGGGAGGTSAGGGAGGTPTSGGSSGGSGASTAGNGVIVGGGGGGTGYITGNGAAGGGAAGGIYNAGTGKLYVVGSSAITNNLAAAGGGGGGIGLSVVNLVNVPFHGGAGGEAVGGIWNATTGQVFITSAALGAMSGNVATDGSIGSAGPVASGGSNAGIVTPAAVANINTSSGTVTSNYLPPAVSSIVGPAGNPNNAASDSFTVNFTENVGGVVASDFTVAKTGTVAGSITAVTPVNPDANGRASSYTVTVGNVTGDGTLALNLNSIGTGITDAQGNLVLLGALGPVYGIEHTLPVVTSIDTVGSSTNNAAADSYTVTFSENVSGVNALDFALANTGTAGGVISSVTAVNGSTYTVTVDPAGGDGTMRLDFHPNTAVVDSAGNLVGQSFTAGQTYTLEHTAPTATSIATVGANPNHAGSDTYTVTFTDNVSGVDASDFTVLTTGGVTGSISSVTPVNPDANGRASTYTVTLGNVSGNGTLQLNLNSSGTGITDAAGNALVVGTLGQVYAIEQTPPVALSIVGPGNNPNDLGIDTFTVNFSEAVGGVDAADFTLFKSGTVAGSITSVTAVNPDANGRATAYTVTVGSAGANVTGDGTLQLNLNATGTGITDAAGNSIVGGAASAIYGIEHTLPVVTSIDTVGSSTNNAAADSYTVTYSENVSGVNALDFALANTGTAGGVISSVTAVNGSTYTVTVDPAGGNGTLRLDFHPNTAVVDAAGNLVGQSFTTGQIYTLEHTSPIVTSIVAAAGDSPGAVTDQFTANFSENVGGVDAADFTLSKTGTVGGSIASVTAVSPDANGRSSAYTVTIDGVTGIGTLQVNLNSTGTAITDAAGNAIVGGALGPVYGVTHTLPTVASMVLVGAPTNNATSEAFTVNFSENVSGVNAADFSLTNTGTAGGVITSVTPVAGSSSSYTVLVSPVVGDGTMRLDLNQHTTIVDATGNTTAGGYTAGPVYTIEHTPPVATSIVTVGNNPSNAATVEYTVTFSEDVTGVDAGDFTLVKGNTVGAAITSITPTSASGNVYTVTVGGAGGAGSITGDGTLQLDLNATGTGIMDAAGNGIVGGAVGEVFGIEHTLPVVTSIATVGSNPNNAGSDQFTVTFSEPVTGVTAADFSLATTGSVLGAITSVTGSGSTYTVLVSPVTGTGTLGLNFTPVPPPADAAGNLVGASFTGSVYTVDHTAPIALSITPSAGDSSAATSDQFTVTFSEPVTGVNAADFSLATVGAVGKIGTVTPVNPVNGASSSYTVSVDGIHGTGTVGLDLNPGTSIADVTGNVIVGGYVGSPYGVNVTNPSVTSITLDDAATNNLTVEHFTVNFSENVGGVVAGDFALTDTGGVGGSIESVTAVNPDGNNRASSYEVTVDMVTGNGTMRLDLSASETGITDAQGNSASGGYTGGPAYTVDHQAPSVSSIAVVDNANNNLTTEQFTVNFSENVGGVAVSDFTLTNGTGSGAISAVTAVNPDAQGRASAYTVTVSNVTGNGMLRLDLNTSDSGITDAANNSVSGAYTSGPTYTINHTAPLVSSITLVDAGTNALSSEQFTVTFSEKVSGVDAIDFALHNTGTVSGSIDAVTAIDPDSNGMASTYTVTVNSVTGNGSMRLDLSAGEAGITDAAGNVASGGYTAGPVYTIEHTPPTVDSITTLTVGPNDSSTQVFTVDFSEGVTGVAASDFTAATTGTVSAGTISVAPTSPFSSTYTVTVSGVSGTGTLGLNVKTSGTAITDAAGNAIDGGFSTGASITIDNTPPTLSSIVLVDAATNNRSSEQFTVNFSESVGGVNANDFMLTNGGNVSGTIASVVAVNPDILGHSSTYTVTVNDVTGNGSMRLDLRTSESGITDLAGNSVSGGYTSGPAYTIQHSPPAVASIALVDPAVNNGTSEQFTVSFTENVSGVTAGDFVLANGGTVSGAISSVTAMDPDGNGRASAYTVTVSNVAGDGSMKLNLSASQSGIEDAAGNAAAGGYASGPTYTVEHTAPVVSSINLVDAPTNNLNTEHFTVTFSEAVGGVTATDFVLSDSSGLSGSIASVTAIDPDANGRASAYTVTANVSSNGTMRLDLSASQTGIADAAGNHVAGGYTAGPVYTVEHTPPAVTSIALVDSATNNAGSDQFMVNFSENVGGVTAGDFVLVNGGSLSGSIASVTAVNPDADGRASSYIVSVNSVTGDGSMRLDVSASQNGITDAAGNTASGAYTAGPSYTIEHTAPVVSSIDLVGNANNDDATEQFTVNFSQSVSGVNAGDFAVTKGGTVTGAIASVTAIDSDADGRASSYVVTVTGVSGMGTMRLDVNNSTMGIIDSAGNSVATGYASGPVYQLGSAVPAVQSISVVGSTTNNAASEQFTVTFSENVTGVEARDFALSDTGTAAGTISSVSGSGSVYSVTVDGVTGDGTMRLDLNSSGTGIVDSANHPITAGFSDGQVVTLQHTAPTVSSITVGASPNNAVTEEFTVTFSENVTGVSTHDFVLSNSGNVAGTISSVTGSGSVYTVIVTGVTGDGTMRLDLNGSGTGIKDAAGNAVDTAFTDGQSYSIEHTLPQVTAITAVRSSPNNAGSEEYTVTFSQDVTGVEAADFSLAETGTAAGVVTSITGSGRTYTVTVGNVTGDGTMQLDLNAGTRIADAAGNRVSGGYDGQVITLDHTPPTVTSITAVGTATASSNADSEQYTVTFSENVTGVEIGDFTLKGTGTAAGKITAVTGSGKTYTVTVSDVTGDGTLQLALNDSASGIADTAGNSVSGSAGTGATSAPTTVRHPSPAVSSIDTVGPGTNDSSTEQYTVTFSENVTGVDVDDFSLVTTGTASGKISSVTGSGKTYVVTVTNASGDGKMRLDLDNSATAIRDASGNAVGAGYTAGQAYTLDHGAPFIESVSAPPSSVYTAGETFDFTVTYNEPVVVDTAGGTPRIAVTLESGGTHYATYVGGSGTDSLTFQYTVGATDQSASGVTLAKSIDLNGAQLTDLAGNSGSVTLVNVASDSGVKVGGVTPQLPPGSTSPTRGVGDTAGVTSAYMGYVNQDVELSDEISTARYLPPIAPLSVLPTSTANVTEIAKLAVEDSVQPSTSGYEMTEPVNTSFTFSVPIGSFQFAPGSIVVVNAGLADGRPLPSWLSFDPSTGQFKGDAPAGWNQHLHVIVVARDQNGTDAMVPVEIQFSPTDASKHPATEPRKTGRLAPTTHRGRESLAAQFKHYGRHARERQLSALVDRV